MKIALPILSARIAPVFDTANRLLVIKVVDGKELQRDEHELGGWIGINRAIRVHELKVNQLICGAISRPLEKMLQIRGVKVTCQICGLIDEVVEAFWANQLMQEKYLMPGCAKQRVSDLKSESRTFKQG